MYDCFDGIKSNICKIVALFFADDGIILMQSLKETIDSIKILNRIPVTTCLNYLGVKVHNKKDCFSLQRELRMSE